MSMLPLDILSDPAAVGEWIRTKYGSELTQDEFHSVFYSELTASEYLKAPTSAKQPPQWVYMARYASSEDNTASFMLPPGIAEEDD